jgi:DnaJ-class molecular chaperone
MVFIFLNLYIIANRRAVYDQYGALGLKNGIPARDGYDGFAGKYAFHGDAQAVFTNFFGGDNPFADYFQNEHENPIALFGAKFGGLNGMNRAASAEGPVQDAAIQRDLDVGLDEVYNGNSVKRVRIQRKVLDDNGMTTTEHETFLTIDVKRGWKTGTRIVFPKEGDQGPNKIPADVVFTVKIRDHETFARQGDDLVVTTTITLVKALTNSVITLTTLDERILRIPINEIIQ